MENTGDLLFDKKSKKYFLVQNGKAHGPLTAQDIFSQIQSHQASLVDFLFCEPWTDYKRIYEVEPFSELLPAKPAQSTIARLTTKPAASNPKPTLPPPQTAISYYLYYNRSQYGPFSLAELEHVLNSHKITDSVYLWCAGWSEWKNIRELPEFAKLLPSAAKKPSAQERRRSPRKPLVAKLFLSNDKDVVIAVCRDISIGGMQVLTDRIPGEVGQTLKLNVSPADAKKVKGFVAEGEIVRILEDRRGFSFRFTKLSTDAKNAIVEYLEKNN